MRTPLLPFDLGGTLIEYFRRGGGGFAPILPDAIRRAAGALGETGRAVPVEDDIERRVAVCSIRFMLSRISRRSSLVDPNSFTNWAREDCHC